MAYYNPDQFFFGTLGRMRMIPAPVRGMSANPEGWGSSGTFLNGGAFVRSSADSHKTYDMEWRSSTSPRVAQILKSYADGTYGRGLIYFQDPTTYLHNVLPARWADPSMSLGYEGRSLVYGVTPTPALTALPEEVDAPFRSATFDLSGQVRGYRGDADSLFIPVPRGHRLLLGAGVVDAVDAAVHFVRVGASGVAEAFGHPVGTITADTVAPTVVSPMTSDDVGVRLWITRTGSGTSATITLSSLMARIVPVDWVTNPANADKLAQARSGPWVGGMGHSGCLFEGKPTWVTNTSAHGGRVSVSASFIEAGDWYFG